MRVTERFHVYPRPRPLCRRLRLRPETADAAMAVCLVGAGVLWLGAVFVRLLAVIGGAR